MMNQKNGFGRRGRLAGLAAAGLVLTTTACSTINYDASTVQSVVSMNRVAPAASYERVGQFEVTQRPVFVIAQLLTVVDADLESALQRELQRTGADAILNLRIHEEYDIIDFAIGAVQGAFLFGSTIVQTRSVTIAGDVVRWNTGFLENGGEQWLGQTCREVIVPGEGSSRTAYVCLAPGEDGAAPSDTRLGLAR